jgi:hypothetical protein
LSPRSPHSKRAGGGLAQHRLSAAYSLPQSKCFGSKCQVGLCLRKWLNWQVGLLQSRNCPVHLERINQDFLNVRIPALKPPKIEFNCRFKVHR